ncbi:MAG: hypothetical protein ACE5FW_02655 [Candidatus Aenigmatarchaeota archaeon]
MAKEKKLSAAVFIDGNNFYHNTRRMAIRPSDIDFSKLTEVICSHFNCINKKSFYYNSVPDIRDGKDKYYSHMKFLSGIGRLPKFIVKTRKLQKNSMAEVQQEKREMLNSVDACEKCRPVIESTCSECIGGFKKKGD